MAYNKVSNKSQDKDVKYLNKDYNSFKSNLRDFAEVYFPNSFNDFSEGNPGMMFLEMAAYVGDVLSYYTDTQLQESFLTLAQDKENIYNMAYAMGYKPKLTSAAAVDLVVSQLVPSKLVNSEYVPDYDYALNIKSNSTFSSIKGDTFYLSKDSNFTFSSSLSPVTSSIYQYDGSNNPEYYILEKTVPAVSGDVRTQTFTIGAAEKFKTLSLFDTNIISIESITDSDGNEYHEVPYLAQDTIFEPISNTAANDPVLYQYNNETPYLLKLKKVQRRFATRFTSDTNIQIQFGAGNVNDVDEAITPDSNNVGIGLPFEKDKLTTAFSPTNFLFTNTYGIAPSNTTLTVRYLTGG